MSNIEEDIKILKEYIQYDKEHRIVTKYDNQPLLRELIENVLADRERLLKENDYLMQENFNITNSDKGKLYKENEELQRIFDTFNKREYRRKYLEERRAEEPDLLYPDADEIYKRYYELKKR